MLAKLWFLMTDGEIFEASRIDFTEKLVRHRLHGKSCVTMIFGRASSSGGPFDCNISVGVSCFGLSPNPLFLFADTGSTKIYIL